MWPLNHLEEILIVLVLLKSISQPRKVFTSLLLHDMVLSQCKPPRSLGRCHKGGIMVTFINIKFNKITNSAINKACYGTLKGIFNNDNKFLLFSGCCLKQYLSRRWRSCAAVCHGRFPGKIGTNVYGMLFSAFFFRIWFGGFLGYYLPQNGVVAVVQWLPASELELFVWRMFFAVSSGTVNYAIKIFSPLYCF